MYYSDGVHRYQVPVAEVKSAPPPSSGDRAVGCVEVELVGPGSGRYVLTMRPEICADLVAVIAHRLSQR